MKRAQDSTSADGLGHVFNSAQPSATRKIDHLTFETDPGCCSCHSLPEKWSGATYQGANAKAVARKCLCMHLFGVIIYCLLEILFLALFSIYHYLYSIIMMCYIHNTCACDSRACVYLYLRNSIYIYIPCLPMRAL